MVDREGRAALALQAWLSPAYPVGAYAYSHALEWAVDCGTVASAVDLRAWLGDNLTHGAGWNDAVLVAETFRRHAIADPGQRAAGLAELAALAAALSATGELRQESLQQGAAFLAVTRKAWPHSALEWAADAFGDVTPYSVCLALAAAAHGCSVSAAVKAYLFALASNWISAAVRLNVIGQTAAQEMSAAFLPAVEAIAARALAAGLDELGGCAILGDIGSFKHEEQYSRLFRS